MHLEYFLCGGICYFPETRQTETVMIMSSKEFEVMRLQLYRPIVASHIGKIMTAQKASPTTGTDFPAVVSRKIQAHISVGIPANDRLYPSTRSTMISATVSA